MQLKFYLKEMAPGTRLHAGWLAKLVDVYVIAA